MNVNNLLNIETPTLKMLELASFVLDINNNFSKIRESGWEFILLLTFWHHKDIQLDKVEIIDKIKTTFGFDNIPSFIVERSLQGLIQKGEIENVGGYYKLTSEGFVKVQEVLTKCTNLQSEAEERLIKIFKKFKRGKVSKEEINAVKNSLYRFLGKIFERWGSVAAKLLLSRNIDTIPLNYERILDDSISNITDEELKIATKNAIKQFIHETPKNESIAKYVSSIAQTYYLIQILNLDPELQNLQRESLANTIAFLDTNIIIPLLCEEHDAHNIVKDVVKYTSKLGINLLITKYTKKEFLRRLEYSNNLYLSYKAEISNLTNFGKNRVRQLLDDIFLKTYLKRREEYPNYSWSLFLSEMKNFAEILRDRYQILLDEKDVHIDNDELQEVRKHVKFANPGKLEFTAIHDAINLLFVDKLRQDDTEYELLGPKYWFITRDRTLVFAEVALIGRKLPVSVFFNDWFEMILPFISADTSKTLAELLRLLLITDLENNLSSEQVLLGISVLGPLINDPKISLETIKKIVGSDYVQKYIERVRGLGSTELADDVRRKRFEEEREKLKLEISKEFSAIIEEERRKHKYKNILIFVLAFVVTLLASIIMNLYYGIIGGVVTFIGLLLTSAAIIRALETIISFIKRVLDYVTK
jgi:predicted nucleic acid-binding protein